jgi:hypothetical protein
LRVIRTVGFGHVRLFFYFMLGSRSYIANGTDELVLQIPRNLVAEITL